MKKTHMLGRLLAEGARAGADQTKMNLALAAFEQEYEEVIDKNLRDLPAQKVEVTKEHCIAGRRKDPVTCPLALAARDAGFVNAKIYDNRLEYDSEGGLSVVWMPDTMAHVLKAYDEGLYDFIPNTLTITAGLRFLTGVTYGIDEHRRKAA
jgi:hypothetical protein